MRRNYDGEAGGNVAEVQRLGRCLAGSFGCAAGSRRRRVRHRARTRIPGYGSGLDARIDWAPAQGTHGAGLCRYLTQAALLLEFRGIQRASPARFRRSI